MKGIESGRHSSVVRVTASTFRFSTRLKYTPRKGSYCGNLASQENHELERTVKKNPEDVVCDLQLLSRDWGHEKLSCMYIRNARVMGVGFGNASSRDGHL